MTIVSVPLAVLIGAAIGLLTTGYVFASDNDDGGLYLVMTIITTSLSILILCGLEALALRGV